MKTINLSPEIELKLANISQQIGKTEDKLIEEALISYLEDLEDIKDAQERLANPPNRYLTLEQVEEELGLADKFEPKAVKELKKLDKATQKRIINYLKQQISSQDNPRFLVNL